MPMFMESSRLADAHEQPQQPLERPTEELFSVVLIGCPADDLREGRMHMDGLGKCADRKPLPHREDKSHPLFMTALPSGRSELVHDSFKHGWVSRFFIHALAELTTVHFGVLPGFPWMNWNRKSSPVQGGEIRGGAAERSATPFQR